MEVMIETCCGIDVHQKSIVCCILYGPLDTNKPKKIQKKFDVTSQSNFHLSPKTGSQSQTTNDARIKSETFREEAPHDKKTKISHSRRPD